MTDYGSGLILSPRSFVILTRFLRYMVRERKLMHLEKAIRKMTSLPAQRFEFLESGVLREEHYADCVIFDSQTIMDRASIAEPNRLSLGIEYVIVNGTLVFEKDKFNEEYPRKVLGKPLKEH